jgi:hypothetical protein
MWLQSKECSQEKSGGEIEACMVKKEGGVVK